MLFRSNFADLTVLTQNSQGFQTVSSLSQGLRRPASCIDQVIASDDEIIPLQQRIETVADETDLEEIYNTERHLLYVACTRARDFLLVTGVNPASEFLDDLRKDDLRK